MKHTALPVILLLAVSAPVVAQSDAQSYVQTDAPPPASEPAEPSFMDFLDRMLRGFMTEVEPQMRELERGLESLEPELQGFLDRMRDMTRYHPPEVLPNGDILIRRRHADDVPEHAPDEQDVPEGDGARSLTPFEL